VIHSSKHIDIVPAMRVVSAAHVFMNLCHIIPPQAALMLWLNG
jgi:hypothetical protein